MLPLFEPGIEAWSRRRLGQLGMAPAQSARAMRSIERALAAGEPVSRAQVVELLTTQGIELNAHTRTHIFVTAVTSGIAAFGPDAERGQPALMAREAWLGKAPRFDPARSLAELARRYFSAFGPATEADFAGWAGLPLRDLRAGMDALGGELRESEVGGTRAWALGPSRRAPKSGVVRLLPGWDNFLMGWRDRGFFSRPQDWERIGLGGGFLRPCVLRDGVAVATWSLRRSGGRAKAEVEPFGRLDAPTRAAVDEELADVARFEGLELS